MIVIYGASFVAGVAAFVKFAGWRIKRNTAKGYYDSEKWQKRHPSA